MEHFWENIIFVIIDQQKILYKKVYSVCFFAITDSFCSKAIFIKNSKNIYLISENDIFPKMFH